MEFASRMEEELKCSFCRRLYVNPIILPSCSHYICLNCAYRIQLPQPMPVVSNSLSYLQPYNSDVNNSLRSINSRNNSNAANSSLGKLQHLEEDQSSTSNESIGTNTTVNSSYQDSDEMSMVSETDSGVVICGSRPESYVGCSSSSQSIANLSSLLYHQTGLLNLTNAMSNMNSCGLQTSNNEGSILSNKQHVNSNQQNFPQSCFKQSLKTPQIAISCPSCLQTSVTNEKGAFSLPKAKTLASIVEKYRENKQMSIECQSCQTTTPLDDKTNSKNFVNNSEVNKVQHKDFNTPSKMANKFCLKCELFYCNSCVELYHSNISQCPAYLFQDLRKPTAETHEEEEGKVKKEEITSETSHLIDVNTLKEYMSTRRSSSSQASLKCIKHSDQNISLFCSVCKIAICTICLEEGSHANHHTQPLMATCKSHKSELSQLLQALSEKAKSGTEFIARLKAMQDRVEITSRDFEANVIAQCDELIEALDQKKKRLLNAIQNEKIQKIQNYREQMIHCSSKLHKTTGLIQFSIEALKETDPFSFMQMSPSLIKRVASVDGNFIKEIEFEPREIPEFQLKLDTTNVMRSLEKLSFIELKAPGTPQILLRECTSESNTITLVWEASSRDGISDGFTLEIDDGNMGHFRKVFTGKESICTVEGLYFDTSYRARVKAFNQIGGSNYSQSITLHTAKVAWFSLDASFMKQYPDVTICNENMTIATNSFDNRTILANVGFIRGVHYWEFFVDRYENNKDPAFGVAKYDVTRDKMLGKDDKGWSMYVDNTRSWFLHNGQHAGRTSGGLQTGSIVGTLLDLERGYMCFYLNGQRQGPIAFTEMGGGVVLYPAVSLNRSVQLTLHSGLVPPALDFDKELISSGCSSSL